MGNSLDKFELWAMWCQNGGNARQSSILGKVIENGGVAGFGGGETLDDIYKLEYSIEAAVSDLSMRDPKKAQVLRVHYGAENWRHLKMPLNKKLRMLRVSQSKYYRLLREAKSFVDATLYQ